MANIETRCTHCKAVFEADEKQIDRKIPCQKCGETFLVRRKLGFKKDTSSPVEPETTPEAPPAPARAPSKASLKKREALAESTVIVPPPENPPPRRTAPPAAAPLIRPVQAASPPENAHASIMDESILDDYEERRADRRKHSIFSLIFRFLLLLGVAAGAYWYVTKPKSNRNIGLRPPKPPVRDSAQISADVSRIVAIKTSAKRRRELRSLLLANDQQTIMALLDAKSPSVARDLADLAAIVPTDAAPILGRIMVLSDAQAASTATRSMTAIADSLYHGIIDLYLKASPARRSLYASMLEGAVASRAAIMTRLRDELPAPEALALLWQLGDESVAEQLIDASSANPKLLPIFSKMTTAQEATLSQIAEVAGPDRVVAMMPLFRAHRNRQLCGFVFEHDDSFQKAKLLAIQACKEANRADLLLDLVNSENSELKKAAFAAVDAIKPNAQQALRTYIKAYPKSKGVLGKMVATSIPVGKDLNRLLAQGKSAAKAIELAGRMRRDAVAAIPMIVKATRANPGLEKAARTALLKIGGPNSTDFDKLLTFHGDKVAGTLAMDSLARADSEMTGKIGQLADCVGSVSYKSVVKTLVEIGADYEKIQPKIAEMVEAPHTTKGAVACATAFGDTATIKAALSSMEADIRAAAFPAAAKAVLARVLPPSDYISAANVEVDCPEAALKGLQICASQIKSIESSVEHLATVVDNSISKKARERLGLE